MSLPSPKSDIDTSTTARAYARWAPIYDSVYTGLLRPGRREAVAAAVACGTDILEVGVGTGLSLPDYPAQARVFGVDLSKPMLDRAAEKVARQNLTQVTGLAVMDACRLGFADNQFDAVVGQYVITLVADPEAALDEFARVLRPGGEIVLVNHIGAERGAIATVERAVAPLVRKMGWRPEFPLSRIRAWAEPRGFRFMLVKPVAPIGFFTVVRMRAPEVAAAAVPLRRGAVG